MDKNVIKELKEWVKRNYDQHSTGYTYERSEGNSYDCFNDGYKCATSWAAYQVGCMLGMQLEEPEPEEE